MTMSVLSYKGKTQQLHRIQSKKKKKTCVGVVTVLSLHVRKAFKYLIKTTSFNLQSMFMYTIYLKNAAKCHYCGRDRQQRVTYPVSHQLS